MKRILVCTLLALGTTAFASAARQEPAVVTGVVTAAESGGPLAGARVHIPVLRVGTVTDAQGRYRLVIPADRLRATGRYDITVTTLGRQSSTRSIQLAPGATTTQNFSLGTSAVALEGVVVTPAARVTVCDRRW